MVVGLALLVLTCCVLPVTAADPAGTLVENTVVPGSNASVVTNGIETIPVPAIVDAHSGEIVEVDPYA